MLRQASDNKGGYIILLSVLVVSAMGLAIAVSLLLLGISSSRTGFVVEQSNQARALANACAEEALQQISTTGTFAGTGGLTLGQGTCSYTVTNTGGSNRTITTYGTVGTVIRRVSIVLDGVNPPSLVSWQEVDDF